MKILNFLLALSLVATAWSQPLTLAEAQRQALEHSHSLKRQESKVRQAGFRVDEAYSGGRPQLSCGNLRRLRAALRARSRPTPS